MSYLQEALKVIPGKEPKDVEPFPAEWLERFDETSLERLAIMTVDGGMTDDEAIETISQEHKPNIRLIEKKQLPQEPKAIWSNPFPKGTPGAREVSLMAVMEAIWTSQFQRIISKVLNGKAKLSDFRQAVEAWERVCKEEIDNKGN